MFCRNCGQQIDDRVVICVHCGVPVSSASFNASALHCPRCGGFNVDTQVYQETQGGSTITKTKSKYRQRGHGCLWWLFIGWWWWMFDLMLWLCMFPIRLLVEVFKKRKYVGISTSVSTTKNYIRYRTIYLCKHCGYHWEK